VFEGVDEQMISENSFEKLRKIWLHAVSLPVLLFFSVSTHSQTLKCDSMGSTQFFMSMNICVSSVLAPQGKNHYGPEQFGRDRGAWCEGAEGNGEGEVIQFFFTDASSPNRFFINNGYDKSRKAFRRNGRVAVLRMSDDADNSMTVYLQDMKGEQTIAVPWPRNNIRWIKFTIIDVYRGSKYSDTCISSFSPDFEGR